MSCKPPSDRAAARRGRFAEWRGPFLLVALLSVLGLGSCQKKIASPTEGTVELALTTNMSGGVAGVQVFVGDSLLWTAGTDSLRQLILPAGNHEIRVVKACTEILPDSVEAVEVAPGSDQTLTFRLVAKGGIQVLAAAGDLAIQGADIKLDGVATGLTTPASLPCVAPGTHTISVQMMGYDPSPDTTVVTGSTPMQIRRPLVPSAQPRRALLELCTATFCTNCWYADAAVESLWTEQSLVDSGYIGLELHQHYPVGPGGEDSLETQNLDARRAQLGAPSSPPTCEVSAILHQTGAGSGPTVIQQLRDQYRAMVHQILDSTHGPSPIALYWSKVDLEPADSLTGTLRVVLLEDVGDTANVVVRAVDYKNNLVTIGAKLGQTPLMNYFRVARDYLPGVSLGKLKISHRGEWADLHVAFPLGWDRRNSGALWSEAHMGVVGFAEHRSAGSWEVLQAAHQPVAN